MSKPEAVVPWIMRSIIDTSLLAQFSWSTLTTKRDATKIRLMKERTIILDLIRGTAQTFAKLTLVITVFSLNFSGVKEEY